MLAILIVSLLYWVRNVHQELSSDEHYNRKPVISLSTIIIWICMYHYDTPLGWFIAIFVIVFSIITIAHNYTEGGMISHDYTESKGNVKY